MFPFPFFLQPPKAVSQKVTFVVFFPSQTVYKGLKYTAWWPKPSSVTLTYSSCLPLFTHSPIDWPHWSLCKSYVHLTILFCLHMYLSLSHPLHPHLSVSSFISFWIYVLFHYTAICGTFVACYQNQLYLRAEVFTVFAKAFYPEA